MPASALAPVSESRHERQSRQRAPPEPSALAPGYGRNASPARLHCWPSNGAGQHGLPPFQQRRCPTGEAGLTSSGNAAGPDNSPARPPVPAPALIPATNSNHATSTWQRVPNHRSARRTRQRAQATGIRANQATELQPQHRRWSRSPSPGNGPALPLTRPPTFPAPVPGKGTLARGKPRPAHRHTTTLGEIPGSSTHPERIPTVPILLQDDYYPVPRLDRLAEAVSFANTPERPHWQNVPTAQSE